MPSGTQMSTEVVKIADGCMGVEESLCLFA
jgi:hypothetical protein